MTFSLFSDNRTDKKLRTEKLLNDLKSSNLTFKVLSNMDAECSFDDLDTIRLIFQKQHPKMPKEYIFRQVFDVKHKNLVIIDKKIIGGICYRPFYEKNFVEIVFCAIDSEVQIQGYGGFLMDLFKEHVKNEAFYNKDKKKFKNSEESTKKMKVNRSVGEEEGLNKEKANSIIGCKTKTYLTESLNYLVPNYITLDVPLYLMTYADNYAIGYFRKNGFSTEIKFTNWIGVIKDYDGGTMMQSKLIWEINYLKKDEFLTQKKNEIIEKMSKHSTFNIIRKGTNPRLYKGVYDIPGMKEAKLTDEMLVRSDKIEKLNDVLKFLLSDLQSHSSSWPFLQPVKQNEVPDYYIVIKEPMDLSTMENKIGTGQYKGLDEFTKDFDLMIKNCISYNGPGTQYFKCAQNLEEFYKKRKGIFE